MSAAKAQGQRSNHGECPFVHPRTESEAWLENFSYELGLSGVVNTVGYIFHRSGRQMVFLCFSFRKQGDFNYIINYIMFCTSAFSLYFAMTSASKRGQQC